MFPIISLSEFFIRSRAANSAVLGPIWPNFELVRDVMNVLVTCKYEEDPTKKEGARVLMICIASDFQWCCLTPQGSPGVITSCFGRVLVIIVLIFLNLFAYREDS